MKLASLEIDILEHRLSSGSIAECLADTEELDISLVEAEAAVAQVMADVKAGNLPLYTYSRIELEVVIDCLDGSTYFAGSDDAVAEGNLTRQKLTAQHKAADTLESAVSLVAGRRVKCVRF